MLCCRHVLQVDAGVHILCVLYSQFRTSPNTAYMSAAERCLVSPWSPPQSAQISDSVSRKLQQSGWRWPPPASSSQPASPSHRPSGGSTRHADYIFNILKSFICLHSQWLQEGWLTFSLNRNMSKKIVFWRNNIKLTDKSHLHGLDI